MSAARAAPRDAVRDGGHQEEVDGKIEDGQMLDPHGMDPQTVLRFVKYVGGWPGRVFVVACEPQTVEDVVGLSEAVGGARPARPRSCSRRSPSCRPHPAAMHELSVARAVLNTAPKHAAERSVTVVNLRVGRLRQVVPDSLRFYFEIVARDAACEGAAAGAGRDRAASAVLELRAEWEPGGSRCSAARGALRRGRGRARRRGARGGLH